jgi:hypothetical protein
VAATNQNLIPVRAGLLPGLLYFCTDCGATGSWKETERHNQPTGRRKFLFTFDKHFLIMELTAAFTLTKRLIETGETHVDYERVTGLAETYRIYITGQDIGKKLIQFVQREDAALFKQRLDLTKSITPASASSVRQPFNKVARNDRIRKTKTIKNETRQKALDGMVAGFYGSRRKKNKGLDYWLKTRFIEMQFIDPNSWVVVEWDAAASESEPVKPRPFEVSAKEAVNFFVVNDEVRWLFVKQEITFLSFGTAPANGTNVGENSKVPGVVTPATAPGEKPNKKNGFRFTLYDEDVTLVYEQVDPEYLKSIGYVLAGNEKYETINTATFIVRDYTPNVGYPPVFRIGYKRDEATKGRTYVNPWHDGLCYFDKSLKTVSELDLTMTLHTFPKIFQYVQKCQGPTRQKKCNQGILQDGSKCPSCDGKGFKIHTTAQDAVLLPMPESKEDMLDLEGLMAYKAPPIELIKFQNEYTQQLERQVHQAVYNSQVFVKKGSTPQGNSSGQPIQTATETDYNMQSVYDTLEPFTEKLSEMWCDLVITFAILAGASEEEIDAGHEFPADYKLKTSDILLGERKTATDSGAPAFLLETIDDDLAGIIYAGDPLGLQKYRVKRRYFPFSGNTPDEIAALVSSQYVPEEPKVLYSNFDQIFKELEIENPEFWTTTDLPKQRELLASKVKQFIERLKAQRPAGMTLDSFREGNPNNNQGGGDGGDGNPGDDDTDADNNDDNADKTAE